MQFHEFIDLVGAKKLSDLLDVSESNVYHWRNYTSSPRPFVAYQLIEFSLGALTWEDIYVPYVKTNYKLDSNKTKLNKGNARNAKKAKS